jgi:16S rRNA C967 or C1407 C5-methylase (RsmB/RsmF family)
MSVNVDNIGLGYTVSLFLADKKSSGMADLEAKPWSKDQLIWQVKETSRWDIKQKEEMKNFHNFIFHENQIGNISRQELVSMVPVLLLVIILQ